MSGHKTKPESDRGRVVCMQCPWFRYEVGATIDRLREIGRYHTHATGEDG